MYTEFIIYSTNDLIHIKLNMPNYNISSRVVLVVLELELKLLFFVCFALFLYVDSNNLL